MRGGRCSPCDVGFGAAHALANRIHQRAHCAPRFCGAGPLTWSSGPSTPFPSDAWVWTCYYPSCFAASHATPPLLTFYCSRFPPRPECPTFYRPGPCQAAGSYVLQVRVLPGARRVGMSHVLQAGSLPPRSAFTKVLRTRGREARACANCWRAHGRKLNRFR